MMISRPAQSKKPTITLRFIVVATIVILVAMHTLSSSSPTTSNLYLRSLTIDAATAEAPAPPAKGGVIVFLHTPKTGGTTIRKTFSKMPGVSFAGLYVSNQLGRVKRKVQEQLRASSSIGTPDTTTLFVEIHDRSTSNLKDMAPLLRQWRNLAKQSGKPFYAFTLVRDPTDYAISLFNFFHVLGGIFGNEKYPRLNGTQDNFKDAMLPKLFNPQCLYLLKGQLFGGGHTRMTQKDCHWVADTLQDTMDWVGDTKTMSLDTLPYLHYLVTGEKETLPVESAYESKMMLPQGQKENNDLLKKEDLDSGTRQEILDKSKMDQALFAATVKSTAKGSSLLPEHFTTSRN